MKAVLHVKPANRLSHLISLAEIELDLMVLNAKENCISDHEIDVELVEELVRNYEHLGEKYTVLCDESGINFHSINSSIGAAAQGDIFPRKLDQWRAKRLRRNKR